MKRDMELVRELLLCVETNGNVEKLCEKYGRDIVAGHVAILLDAKLIVGSLFYDRDQSRRNPDLDIVRLTWAGHEFLDDARDETVWNKVTSTIKNAATTASFEVLVEMLKAGALAAIQK